MTDWFYPAYKGGGPIRSCTNLALLLAKYYSVYVITSSHDYGDKKKMTGISEDVWISFEKNIKVIYLSKKNESYRYITKLIKLINPISIYLNSMFSKVYTLYILLFKLMTSNYVKIILAPRGMLKVSALRIKQTKKKVFLGILKQLKVYKNLSFHATDDIEKENIHETLGVSFNNIMVIPNISVFPDNKLTPLKKEIGKINLVFISRIAPIKNLTCLLNTLIDITEGTIHLNIFGPIEDQNYWKQCEEIIGELPKNISVAYNNELPHPKVKPELLKNHFLVLPTKGENFGHIIFESFAYGRPVIISDQTPWKGLNNKNVGWDVPIDNTKLLSDAIEKATNLDQNEYDLYCKSSLKFANQFYNEADYKNQYIKLFS